LESIDNTLEALRRSLAQGFCLLKSSSGGQLIIPADKAVRWVQMLIEVLESDHDNSIKFILLEQRLTLSGQLAEDLVNNYRPSVQLHDRLAALGSS